MPNSPALRTVVYLLIPPVLWAGNSVVGRYAVDYIGPFSLSFYRWLIASVILLAFSALPLWACRRRILSSWWQLTVLGVLGIGVFNTLLYLGLTTTSANNSGIILTTLPIMIILLNFSLGLEKVRPVQLLGLLCSLAGVIWVITGGDTQRLLQLELNLGDLIILAGVLSWALYSVLLRKLRPADIDPLPFLAIQFLIGLVFILPFYLYELQAVETPPWETNTWLILAYVGIFPSLIAFYFWQQGVAMGGANIAGFIYPTICVFTALLAWLFIDEALNSAQIRGAGLVVAGIILALSNSFKIRS